MGRSAPKVKASPFEGAEFSVENFFKKNGSVTNADLPPSQRTLAVNGIVPMVLNEDDRGDTIVEGITIIDAPSYNLTLHGKKMEVRNVKLLSWNWSTDGVSGAGGLVENCFSK